MKDVHLTVAPAAGLDVTGNRKRVVAEVTYSREVTGDDESADTVVESVRVPLDERFQGAADLQAVASSLEISVLSADGSALFTRTVAPDDAGRASLTFDAEELKAVDAGGQKIPDGPAPEFVSRRARLVPTGAGSVEFLAFEVVVAPIVDAAALAASGAAALLRADGTKVVSLDVTGQDVGSIRSVEWAEAHLSVDGTITTRLRKQKTLGWLWWLTGPRQAIGFIVDDLERSGGRLVAIALPLSAAKIPPAPASSKSGCGSARQVPADVTETEVAENPAVYSEDPGAFCKPFSNPERVLSEKRFTVIARIGQPSISPIGSGKTKTLRLLDLDGDGSTGGLTGGAGGGDGGR